MRRTRNTKIVATLGPASSSADTLSQLFRAGADVFRLNFSHGTHDDHRARVLAIRKLEQDVQRPIGILLDLQGPKLRVGTFETGSVVLRTGQDFRLDLDTQVPGDVTRVSMPHPEIFAALRPDTDLLLDDGKIRLRVLQVEATHAMTRVVVGGALSNRKGVNVPSVILPLSALTPKDIEDLAFGLDQGVDVGGVVPSCSARPTFARCANASAGVPASWPSWRSPRPSLIWTRSLPRPMP